MKIDYVIISSDENPLYKDFYIPVAKKWNNLGYKVFYINICDEDSELITNEFGLIKKIKAVENIDNGFQSQVVRIFASTLIPEDNILLSDIDMMPLNGDYFNNRAKEVDETKILLYSGQPYGNTPYYPMCYILGKGKILKEKLFIEDNYISFINKMKNFSNLDWNSDEKYIYEMLLKTDNKIILNDRDFSRRIDRSNWIYDNNKLKNGYYIDSHLLKPYKDYKELIDKLI